MTILKAYGAVGVLCLAAACAAPSVQHATQSADHSAQAASHGVSAAASGVATVSAVPVLAGGSVLAVTGAALEQVGNGAVNASVDVLEQGVGVQTCGAMTVHGRTTQCVAPDGPPRLN